MMIDVWRRWRWMVMMKMVMVMMLLDAKTGRTTRKVTMKLLPMLLLRLITWMKSHTTSPADTWTTTPVRRTTGTTPIDTVRWSVPATRCSWW
uniref:Putative secreted protein n=1 Tax=Anopheles darlingi TaxID=43151 RepID=A0A2M4DEE9_ANODA